MSSNVYKLLAGLMTVSLLLSPALVLAETAGGTGPGDAMAPSSEWTPLTKGEMHWYAFEYRGHEEMQKVDEDADADEDEEEAVWVSSNIQILLDSEPDQSVAFSIGTPENIREWTLGEEEMEPVGRGGEDESAPGDLCWCGTFERPGTYYVVVEHTGIGPDTAYYSLEIHGSDVSFTAPEAQAAQSVEPEAAVVPAVMDAAGATAGTGPENALAITDEWTSLSEGEVLWYAFQYRGRHEFEEDEDEEVVAVWIATPVHVWLDSEPDGNVVFGIWTEEQVRAWAQGEEIEPVGRGTENEDEPGDLFWGGNLGQPGRYYVVVELQGAKAGSFRLSISGEDVSS